MSEIRSDCERKGTDDVLFPAESLESSLLDIPSEEDVGVSYPRVLVGVETSSFCSDTATLR